MSRYDFTELACMSRCEQAEFGDGNPARGFFWSPDGLRFLVLADDFLVRLFDLRQGELCPTLTSSCGGTVYDVAWLPRMDSREPDTCVYAACARDTTIGLFDAFSGRRRTGIAVHGADGETLRPAFSLAFAPDSDTLWAGCRDGVAQIDLARPHADDIVFHATRGAWHGGAASAVSALACTRELLASGTYHGDIAISAGGSCVAALPGAHPAGVTQLGFAAGGALLVSGGRRDNALLMWDMRALAAPLARLPRCCRTNQRLQFTTSGRALATATHGSAAAAASVLVYDLAAPDESPQRLAHPALAAANAAAFHPSLALLGVACGARRPRCATAAAAPNDDDDDAPPHAAHACAAWSFAVHAAADAATAITSE